MTETGQMSLRELAATGRSGRVQVWDRKEQQVRFSAVNFWIHADEQVTAEFTQITTESGKRISMTWNHLIYRSAACEQPLSTVFASRVAVGDCLRVSDGVASRFETVSRVDRTRKRGIYAPVTVEGSLFVNGISASCYANHENEDIQRFIYSFTVSVRDFLRPLLPTSLVDQIFGSDGPHSAIPRVLLTIEKMQTWLLA